MLMKYQSKCQLLDKPVVHSRRSNIKLSDNAVSLFLYCPFCLLAGKSCMTLLTMARYEWFEEWKDTNLGKRGQDYLDLKNSMAQELLDWALTIFPQLRDKVCVIVCMSMYRQVKRKTLNAWALQWGDPLALLWTMDQMATCYERHVATFHKNS